MGFTNTGDQGGSTGALSPYDNDRFNTFLGEFTADLSAGIGTFDLCTAVGWDCLVYADTMVFYMSQGGLLVTSLSFATSQSNPTTLLSAVEGALVNLGAQKVVQHAFAGAFILKAGQKIRYTVVGILGSGLCDVKFEYRPLINGARVQ